MSRSFRTLEFPGHMTKRGFSLYVWEIKHPTKGKLLYVGRTGDSSSPNASSPIRRMGQHFHPVNKGNTLYSWLKSDKYCVEPESCTSFKLFSYGPLSKEVKPDGSEPKDKAGKRKALMCRHKPLRDVVGALEKALADNLRKVGYEVMNPVPGKSDTESHDWHEVLAAFKRPFPKLKKVLPQYSCGIECPRQEEMPDLNVDTP